MEESNISLNSKENADMISDETKSDTLEAHSEFSASDANNRISSFEAESCIKPGEDSSQPLSLNNKPSKNCPDIASEHEAPSSVIDNDDTLPSNNGISMKSSSSSSSNCSSDLDYYEGDEDLERFCEQEMSTSKGREEHSRIEALKIEGGKFLESLASSNNETGTPTTEIMLEGAEPAEGPFNSSVESPATSNTELHTSALNKHDLLMQVFKFFAKNPIVGEVVDRNELVTSRYFTDEFALQHGLTVDENEVSIRNELEHDTMMESPDLEKSLLALLQGLTVDEDEVLSTKNELEQNIPTESSEPDSHLRRLGELLEWRPFCILMTLFKFYLYSRYSY